MSRVYLVRATAYRAELPRTISVSGTTWQEDFSKIGYLAKDFYYGALKNP